MTRTACHQQPNLAGIYPAVLDVDVGHSLCPVELHQTRVDALVQKLDALTEQPQFLFVQSANNPVTDHHHQVQSSPYTSIIIPHRANQRPFLLCPYTLLIISHRAIQRPFLCCPSTLLILTHHPSQGKSTSLFYSVLLLHSSSLTGQINQPFLLCPSTWLILTHHPSQGKSTSLFYSVLLLDSSSLIIPHRANQPAFSTLSLPFPTPTISQCMPLSNSCHQHLHHICFRFQSFPLCSKYCRMLTTVSKDF